MDRNARGKGRRGAVVGALCMGLLTHYWQPPGGCFVTVPGGKHQHHQRGTARGLRSIAVVDAPPSDSVEEVLGELKLAGIRNSTSATEPNIVRSKNVWDSWLATPWLVDVTDAAVAALGAGFGLAFVAYLDGISPVKLYAGPMASSVIILFTNIKPPPLKNVLIGTAGPAIGSLLCHQWLSQCLPVITSSVSVAISLIFFKFTGFFFPPAAAIAASGVDSWSYVIFPAITGNVLLYGFATMLSNLREEIRAVLTTRQWRMGTRDEKVIKDVFDRFDMDGNGTVDVNELHIAMRYLVGKDVSLELTQQLMAKVDSDGNGSLDLTEFICVFDAYQSLQAHLRPQKTT